MLTIMIHATIKEEELDNFIEVASLLTKETRENREGCISYSFNQRSDSPREFVLYEQWENQESLDIHIKELAVLLGPPKPGQILPERLINMYEKAVPVYYNPIE